MTYAPVLVTVYNRLEHFKKCIHSLSKNLYADKTPLFIAIDCPYKESDINANNEIFEFCKKIEGFKSIEIIRRDQNVGAVNNSKMARDYIFTNYDKLIRTEDDNIFSPYFLKFINAGLNYYAEDSRIFSICGYSEPILIDDIISDDDAYLRRGFSSFGFGIWRDKFLLADSNASSFYSDLIIPNKKIKFIRDVGSNIYIGLLVSKRLNKVYPDMAYVYHIYKNNLFSIHPKKSLVRNIGQDGSGLHSGINPTLQNQAICFDELDIKKISSLNCENKEIRNRLNFYHRQDPVVFIKYIFYYYFNFIKQCLKK